LEELTELEVVQAQDARVEPISARAAAPDHALGLEDRQVILCFEFLGSKMPAGREAMQANGEVKAANCGAARAY